LIRTSQSDPIQVAWLPLPWPGRVGLTFAPGKKQPNGLRGQWDRDLGMDLDVLRTNWHADHLVSLVDDPEFRELQIQGLVPAAEARKIEVCRFPIADGSIPRDSGATSLLVGRIVGWAAAGENVVIHCKGGLGRAGTVGGCVLRASGQSPEASLEALRAARGRNCPETSEQRKFIADFQATAASSMSRVLGAVMGAAIGDAMGHPTEFLSSDAIRRKFGLAGVTGFELWWNRDGGRFAPYTDDTQMAEVVLRALVQGRRNGLELEPVMEDIAAGFVEWRNNPQGGHRAPGNACMAGAAQLAAGVHWSIAGGAEAGGCGSVMRAYPFRLVFADDLKKAEYWSVEHSKLTHRAPIALAACTPMAVGVASTLNNEPLTEVLSAMVAAAARCDTGTAAMTDRAANEAGSGVGPEVTLDRLRGWAAHEAIAAATYVVARHPADARAAILEGANTQGDSDSIATLAGALTGARTGIEGLPVEWVRDIERFSELLGLAKSVTW
jgi:ADP-ribosyl-[dinitrogen reductase] hydrolase